MHFHAVGRDPVVGEVRSGVVDEDVDLLVAVLDDSRRGAEVLAPGQVNGDDVEPVLVVHADTGAQDVGAGGVAGHSDDVGARIDECGGDDLSHAAGGSGHDRGAVPEVGDRCGHRVIRGQART